MNNIVIRCATTSEDMHGLHALRVDVFVREQGVRMDEELDVLDQASLHAVAWNGYDVVGTGRLTFMDAGEAQIGRMAVRAEFRRGGIGGGILRFLESQAKAKKVERTFLHAQTYVVAFYIRHGYQQEGTSFNEAGIEHILMSKTLI